MKEYEGLKIGDRVVVKSWAQFQPKIISFKKYDNQNNETNWEFDCGYVRMELDWSEYGFANSKINFHDENVSWHRFSSAN